MKSSKIIFSLCAVGSLLASSAFAIGEGARPNVGGGGGMSAPVVIHQAGPGGFGPGGPGGFGPNNGPNVPAVVMMSPGNLNGPGGLGPNNGPGVPAAVVMGQNGGFMQGPNGFAGRGPGGNAIVAGPGGVALVLDQNGNVIGQAGPGGLGVPAAVVMGQNGGFGPNNGPGVPAAVVMGQNGGFIQGPGGAALVLDRNGNVIGQAAGPGGLGVPAAVVMGQNGGFGPNNGPGVPAAVVMGQNGGFIQGPGGAALVLDRNGNVIGQAAGPGGLGVPAAVVMGQNGGFGPNNAPGVPVIRDSNGNLIQVMIGADGNPYVMGRDGALTQVDRNAVQFLTGQ